MSLLTVFQGACTSGIALEKPTAVFGSSVREHLELAALANEMAAMIAESHEWQVLQRIATVTGDGTTTDFDLPSDYARMLTETQLWSSTIDGPLMPIRDRDDWLNAITKDYDFMTNAWILYAGQLHFRPALDASETVKYFYQSNLWGQTSGATNIDAFTADNDTFRLDERLLKLGIIWRWREMKGLPYAENLNDYELLKEKLIHRDRGPSVLRDSGSRMRGMGQLAYPWNIPL